MGCAYSNQIRSRIYSVTISNLREAVSGITVNDIVEEKDSADDIEKFEDVDVRHVR